MRQGLSGFNVKKNGDHVIKSTVGYDSSARLKIDIKKQINSIGKMYPIASVPIISVESDCDFFNCKMPYMGIDLKDAVLNKKQLSILEKSISLSLKNRCLKIEKGFNEILLAEVRRISNFVKEIYGQYESLKIIESDYLCESDKYIRGYCHGDLGFRNLFMINETVYASDFTDSFIESPLVDIVMLNKTKDGLCLDKLKIVENINREFKEFRTQIIALEKIKALKWKYRA